MTDPDVTYADDGKPVRGSPDVTERVERTDVGFRLTVESTLGMGTLDQDKVKAELRTETFEEALEKQDAVVSQVIGVVGQLRRNRPDEDGGSDD